MSDRNTGTVVIHVYGILNEVPIALCGAEVTIAPEAPGVDPKFTNELGTCTFELPEGDYSASAKFEFKGRTAGGKVTPQIFRSRAPGTSFHICKNETDEYGVEVNLPSSPLRITFSEDNRSFLTYSPESTPLLYGQQIFMKVESPDITGLGWDIATRGADIKSVQTRKDEIVYTLRINDPNVSIYGAASGLKALSPRANDRIPGLAGAGFFAAKGPNIGRIEGSISTSLKRSASFETDDIALWSIIRRAHEAISFDRYMDFMNWIFCGDTKNDSAFAGSLKGLQFLDGRRFLPFSDTDAYRNIKAATEAFLMANCCIYEPEIDEVSYIADHVAIDLAQLRDPQALITKYLGTDKILPYLAVIRAKLQDQKIKDVGIGDVKLGDRNTWPRNPDSDPVSACYGILRDKLTCPCLLELIWSYWNEEGMLVQTMNAIARRFQNMRGPQANDPLANLEVDPLRPLNNLIWGWVQDEQHRLSVVRRNYEYDHHYGLRLAGKAVDNMRTADSRSKFLEAFHMLLSSLAAFYRRDDDTTMVADGFPVLNALKEAHLILSQGAHNQFGDLPSTARIEMLMQQWILARPEFREFIPTRIMVAYPEPWMDRVDAMKKLQNWTDTSVLHFRNLAIFGEQVILGVRYGNWNSVYEPVHAVNWARYWRPQVQGYLHAYRSVTGVDLTVDVTNDRIDAMMPSVHLVRRLTEQQRVS